ncbi:unnamed protein product [Choristocarpus tenellus]
MTSWLFVIMSITAGMFSSAFSRGPALLFGPETTALLKSKDLKVRELVEADLQAVTALEAASFPPDEAASPENLRFRQANAGAFFLEGRLCQDGNDNEEQGTSSSDGYMGSGGKLVGFVCGTCCPGSELSHESMSDHDPSGPTLCIHSVVVDQQYRRSGIASALLKAYVEQIETTQPGIQRIVLISKAHLVPMYESCGFRLRGQSTVVHGKDPWFELRKEFNRE